MQANVEEFDLESMKSSLGDNVIELPTYGAGFPRRLDGCKYVSNNEETKCTMPDGTVFNVNDQSYGETESIRVHTFVKKIIEWAEKHARPKLRLSDETEFMDI